MSYFFKNFKYRWLVLGMLFFATTINYVDRFVLGILAPQLEKQIGWTEEQYSYIISAFQIAYGIGNVVMGYVIDRLGTRFGYVLTFVIWSISNVFHAFARSWIHFAVARFSLGIGEAGNFPAAIKSVAEWFPKKERALATGLFNSGSQIGVILASLAVPVIFLSYNWQAAFLVTGIFSFLWILLWAIFYRKPEEFRHISKGELSHILEDEKEEKPASNRIQWTKVIKIKETWAIAMLKLMSDPVWWFYLFWGAKFLNKKFEIDIASISIPFVVIYATADVGGIFFGGLSSWFLKRGWSLNKARKTTMLFCALMVLPLVFITHVNHFWLAILILTSAVAGHCGWAANVFTLVSDIFPKKVVGSVVGIGNTTSTTGAAIASFGIGLALSNAPLEGYIIPFTVAAFGYIVALGIFNMLVPEIKEISTSKL
ncbi:MFS transporter [Bacteroidota bacterium]